MRIILDNLEIEDHYSACEKYELLNKLSNAKYDWKTKQTIAPLTYVEDNIVEGKYHSNYLEYLSIAYRHHYGVQLSPDIFWYTLLSEIASMVAEDTEHFRKLFTDSAEKKEILVHVEDSNTVLPLGQVMTELKQLVPKGFSNHFLKDFTTTNERSRFAQYAAFADVVSVYYDYKMLMCGIPFVDLLGTNEDWHWILTNWTQVGKKFRKHKAYFAVVKGIIEQIILQFNNPDTGFWDKMIKCTPCGSGSDFDVSGWFRDLLRVQPKYGSSLHNFSSHVAKVTYTNYSTKKKYTMRQGILSSQVQEQLLIPHFSHVIYEGQAND